MFLPLKCCYAVLIRLIDAVSFGFTNWTPSVLYLELEVVWQFLLASVIRKDQIRFQFPTW